MEKELKVQDTRKELRVQDTRKIIIYSTYILNHQGLRRN